MRVRVPPATPEAGLADVVIAMVRSTMEVRSIRTAGTIFFRMTRMIQIAHVAQLDEHEFTKLGDAGSSPVVSSTFQRCRRAGIGPCATARLKAKSRSPPYRRQSQGWRTRRRPHFSELQGIGEPGRPCLPWKEETGGSNPPALTISCRFIPDRPTAGHPAVNRSIVVRIHVGEPTASSSYSV
jgi:hypothetical protein